MELSFTLFLSGSPQDYEWLPQSDNHAKQVCEKYFNLPSTDTPHHSDLYVELFPNDNFAYYTYIHRKAVNGMPREGAHIALTMRIKGGYITAPRTIYNLLDMVYVQYVDGRITQRKGNGEVYIVPSLLAYEQLRKQMEDTLAMALKQLVASSLVAFGPEVARYRQEPSVKHFPADADNEQMLIELRKTHKLRLIPSEEAIADRTAPLNATIEKLQQASVQKDNEIARLTSRLKEAESRSQTSTNAHKSSTPTPPAPDSFQQTVLRQLATMDSKMDALTSTRGRKNTKTQALTYLPWLLLVVAIIYVIISGLQQPKSDDQVPRLQAQIVQFNKELNAQRDIVRQKDKEIQQLREQLEESRNNLAEMVKSKTTPAQPTPTISVGTNADKRFLADKVYDLTLKNYDKPYSFKVDGDLRIHGNPKDNKVYCVKAGSGTITAYDAAGKEIRKRTIKIEAQ